MFYPEAKHCKSSAAARTYIRRQIKMFVMKRDTQIADILELAPEVIPLFSEIGMHCIGCALSSEENVEQACMAHGVDVDNFLEKCNEVIADFAID